MSGSSFHSTNSIRIKIKYSGLKKYLPNPQSTEIYPAIRAPYGPALETEIPEIESFVRIKPTSEEIEWGETSIKFEKVLYADKNFFQFFSFSLLLPAIR